ncbi:MAG TPA: hypothetical protein QGF58_22300 [Myxococcota bacterium]|nr:hypothetical protein [Myxococcota bacterium]
MTRHEAAAALAAQPFQALLDEIMPDMEIVDFDGTNVTLRSDFDEDGDEPTVCTLSELLRDMADMTDGWPRPRHFTPRALGLD